MSWNLSASDRLSVVRDMFRSMVSPMTSRRRHHRRLVDDDNDDDDVVVAAVVGSDGAAERKRYDALEERVWILEQRVDGLSKLLDWTLEALLAPQSGEERPTVAAGTAKPRPRRPPPPPGGRRVTFPCLPPSPPAPIPLPPSASSETSQGEDVVASAAAAVAANIRSLWIGDADVDQRPCAGGARPRTPSAQQAASPAPPGKDKSICN